jgi:uncharacterized protein YndB with AHSA1/START domain
MTTTRVVRRIEAPRAAVYAALLDPDLVQRWMVPEGMRSEVHHFDPVVGGGFRISLTYEVPDGSGSTDEATDSFHGVFARLVPDTAVVQMVEFETDDPDLQGQMTIIYALEDQGGATRLVGTHLGLPDGIDPDDNETGWRLSIDKLAAIVEAAHGGAPGRSEAADPA